jgi:hypothetical protein
MMDLLDRLLGHDAWTTRQLFLLSEDLSWKSFLRDPCGSARDLKTHKLRTIHRQRI